MQKNCDTCKYGEFGNAKCVDCVSTTYTTPSHWEAADFYEPDTNADRIRAMSDEELAAWMAECNAYGERADASQWIQYLRQPAEVAK